MNVSVVAVGHTCSTGPVQALKEFLKSTCPDFVFIGHPFYSNRGLPSYMKVYFNCQLKSEKRAPPIKAPDSILYLKDAVVTLMFTLLLRRRFQVYVGIDCLNALVGIVLRKLRIVEKVVFYTIDLAPTRFENSILNRIYHLLDCVCVKNSDFVWNLSAAMIEERERWGVSRHMAAPQLTVPIGTNFKLIQRQPLKRVERRTLVYLGTLREGQGLELILGAFPRLVEEISGIKLFVIGDGPLRKSLEERVKREGIERYVNFFGFIKNHRDIEGILSRCGVGLALYEPSPDNLTRFTEPTKPKTYMSCGLPVIITKVPKLASDIERLDAGLVIEYAEEDLINSIKRLLLDEDFYVKSRRNAISFASESEWESIFLKAFEECRLLC